MQHITKPMLAGKCEDIHALKYPVLATAKLDGIRCLKVKGKCLSRKFKPIPCTKIREFVERNLPDGVDGELIIPNTKFNEISSVVMSEEEPPEGIQVQYIIFDYVKDNLDKPYAERMKDLQGIKKDLPWGQLAASTLIGGPMNNAEELQAFIDLCEKAGYEGVIVRDPQGPYKLGRSTTREGYLLKIKKFDDAEGTVVGFEEKMHNTNKAKKDAFGRTERSHMKAGLVPAGTLGKLMVKDEKTEAVFGVGTGFDDKLRQEIWDHKDKYMGQLVKYKYQKFGTVNKPRIPVFIGFRHKDDL